MMKRYRIPVLTWIALAGLALAGCGGGAAPAASLGGGIGGTGKPALVLGTVTALGSVQVGGRTYDTSSADIVIDGVSATESDLQLGMVVRLEVDDSTGAARRVEVEDLIQGPISAIGVDTLTVLGQVIEVDEQTVFGAGISPAGLAGLQPGDLVEVHGFVRGTALIAGRRIERENSLSEYRVTGFAASIDTTLRTFAIGSQAIDYASADTSDLAGGHPTSGQLVQVRGLVMLTMAGAIDATDVRGGELEDEEDNDQVEVEGFVSAIVSPTRFLLGGIPVVTTAGTLYEGGTAAEVVAGVLLEVEGALVSGVLSAREIQFKESIRLESDIASVSGNMITLAGLPGVSIVVNSATAYEDDASSLGDLQVGDHVEIRGRMSGATLVTATQIKETGAKTDLRLRGPVDPGASDPLFSILGVSIDTTGLSDAAFEGEDDQVLGRAGFFSAIASGGQAEARGELVAGAPVWDQVELETEAD
jgi:hypothetical protein